MEAWSSLGLGVGLTAPPHKSSVVRRTKEEIAFGFKVIDYKDVMTNMMMILIY
jgi:hypothetical protein